MAGTFDFAPGKHVWEEIPPDEIKAVSFRGWEATTKPSVPYRPQYKLTLNGMRWYLNTAGNAFDVATNPTFNAARLRAFYIANRLWDTFSYTHETLGTALYKFAAPVNIPPGLPMSGGLIDKFEVVILPADPAYQ